MAAPTIVQNIDRHVVGRVAHVNDKGIKLDDQENWFNVSRFAVGVVLPERGQIVRATLDKGGYLRAVEAADGSALTASTNGAHGAASGQHGAVQRDRTITRLAVLKAAAEFSASKPGSSSSDVLKVAAAWERWVNRDDDEPDDLTDAF